MHGPNGHVWTALTDPVVLVTAIPGCERLEPAGPDAYRFVITAGVASIQGTYTGTVALSDQREPDSFVLTARGAGAPGTIATSIRVTLTSAGDGTTELGYDADAEVGGLLAGIGQRMLASMAGRLLGDFFTAVDQTLDGAPVGASQRASDLEPVSGSWPLPGGEPARAAQPAAAFLTGAFVGAAVTAAGVAASRLLGRRTR
jgi:carbon monoxide dehydrogenase subunit G